LHQDNALCHTARKALIKIDFLGLQLLPHAPLSPDIASMDFRPFPELMAQLQGIRFQTFED
jgi:hypothetical protein